MKKFKFVVTGRVQGVFFRKYTQQKAMSLGIRGEVRNMPDGTVQVIVCADEDAITEFEKWLWKGSPMAKVRRVDAIDVTQENQNENNTEQGFYIK